MTSEIIAAAPGKIILFGEHSVVYGRPALAVPVTQVQAQCKVEPAPPGAGITIIAPDLDEHYQISNAPPDDPLAAVVQRVLATLNLPAALNLNLTVTSTIPIARGLGSGAAISTAIVKALSQYLDAPLAPQQTSDIVFEVEKIHHGTPSGIDNNVVAFARPIYFVKGEPIAHLRAGAPLTFVIGDTGVKSETYKVVGDLRSRRLADKDYYEPIFDSMGQIAVEARRAIEGGNLSAIGGCMIHNHRILDQISISTPVLNRLVESAMQTGALGAKLSGAGWGGNMIALAKSDNAERIARALQDAGAVNTIITVVS